MAEGFKIADAYVSVTLDRDQLRSDIAGLPGEMDGDVDRAGNNIGNRLGGGIGDGANGAGAGRRIIRDVEDGATPDATRSGQSIGDRVSQGMEMSFTRNSPMIVAAVSGVLIAGAPTLIAAAGSLFGAIAAVAVHSNADLQTAFNTTKDTITSTFTDAAQVTVPFFINALGRIGTAVHALGPQLKDAFSSLGDPIGLLTTGLINLVNNAMPGIVSAVKSAGPVFQGLASMLGSIGTGIGQMFSIVSQHSQAAGSVFADLGQILGSLLPILGQLMGAGVELASQVLPPVVSILHGVSAALSAVAPALAPVLAGFLAFKGVTLLAAPIALLATKIAGLGAAGAAASGALTRFSGMLPAIAVGVAALSAAWSASNTQLEDWAKGLEQGGQAAATATQQLQDAHSRSIVSAHSLSDAWSIVKGAFSDGAAQIEGYSSAQDKATQTSRDFYNSLSPLGKAQADVTKAQNDYNYAVDKWGATSGQAIGAAVAYQTASQHEKDVQDQLSTAIHGVTQAMIDQANQALASADSHFAYQRDILASKDAELALQDAIKKHGASSEDAQKATLDFNQALLSQAEAAGKAAADTSGLTDQTDLSRVSQQATLQELLNLKQQYGAEFPAALQNTIDRLQAAGVKLDDVGSKQPTPQVKLDDGPFQGVLSYVNGAIQTLHGQRPSPTAFMDDQPFQGAAANMNSMLTFLAGRKVAPSATLIANTLAAENQIDAAARNRTVYVSTVYLGGPVGAAARPNATGGVMLPMAAGGIVAMAAGADIFEPNNPTVLIGDNTKVRESFIPQDGSPRSRAILTETASAMGYGLVPTGLNPASGTGASNGGGVTVHGGVTLSFPNVATIADPNLPRALLQSIEQGLVKLQRERR